MNLMSLLKMGMAGGLGANPGAMAAGNPAQSGQMQPGILGQIMGGLQGASGMGAAMTPPPMEAPSMLPAFQPNPQVLELARQLMAAGRR